MITQIISGENIQIADYPKDPCVYFVSDDRGHCKIGYAKNFSQRMNNLQVGSVDVLKPIYLICFQHVTEAKIFEEATHYVLKDSRVRGEWFKQQSADELLDLIHFEALMFLKYEYDDTELTVKDLCKCKLLLEEERK